MDSGLRGSGDYGVLALGAYAGQGANRPDGNGDPHLVARLTYPFTFPGGQIVELGAQAYRGRYVVKTSAARPTLGAPAVVADDLAGLLDERAAVSAIWYPQPFGLQAEYNVGQGPALDATQTRVGVAPLRGGYIQTMMRLVEGTSEWIPFLRWQVYEGGKKAETDAPVSSVNEWEAGVEWRVSKELEWTLVYTRMNRTNVLTYPYAAQSGDLVRTQVQWNY